MDGGGSNGGTRVMGLVSPGQMDAQPSEVDIGWRQLLELGVASAWVQALVAANPLSCRNDVWEVFQDNPAWRRGLPNCGFEYRVTRKPSRSRAMQSATLDYSRKLD